MVSSLVSLFRFYNFDINAQLCILRRSNGLDSDMSNRSSDGLRNVVMGRVTEDGSWTEVGRFSDVKTVTFHGEEIPEEFTTKHLRPWNDVSFTAELLEPTIAKQIADKIYTELITPFLLQMAEQLAQTEEMCVCYANPEDRGAVEFIKTMYATMPLRTLNDVVYTKAVEKGKIYLVPVSKIYANLLGLKADTTIIDELATREPPVRDISWLKKQLKHCKNPMERKALEKELNAAFKENKKRRSKK